MVMNNVFNGRAGSFSYESGAGTILILNTAEFSVLSKTGMCVQAYVLLCTAAAGTITLIRALTLSIAPVGPVGQSIDCSIRENDPNTR